MRLVLSGGGGEPAERQDQPGLHERFFHVIIVTDVVRALCILFDDNPSVPLLLSFPFRIYRFPFFERGLHFDRGPVTAAV